MITTRANPECVYTISNNQAATGPKYDGKYLRDLLERVLGSTTIKQTLTDVIIPTFDIKRLQPIIFSTDDAKQNVSKNALLSDICISTSAAPTYFPAHYFETKDEDGSVRSFDLIDGGVAANNPQCELGHGRHSCFHAFPIPACQKELPSHSKRHTLTGDEASTDVATEENMQRLVQIGKELLEKPVSRVNLETGKFEAIEEKGLVEKRLATLLSCFQIKGSSDKCSRLCHGVHLFQQNIAANVLFFVC
ncbi:acyl transferase/acyl hydrolase/lysophospholipase superfamily protein [Actinidia rufa]|uniref:Patatin n=1 Tax=Actinidia rufa TaxID=165716 RepID=A0A7J0H6S1_9ERIC|nr:acyl transferase/acyl hydrolase/lysophospholipase superfamily protein [Actinidia rufa]